MKAITTSDKPQINQHIHQLIKMMHERNTNKERGRQVNQVEIPFQQQKQLIR